MQWGYLRVICISKWVCHFKGEGPGHDKIIIHNYTYSTTLMGILCKSVKHWLWRNFHGVVLSLTCTCTNRMLMHINWSYFRLFLPFWSELIRRNVSLFLLNVGSWLVSCHEPTPWTWPILEKYYWSRREPLPRLTL